jgi:hypothetical protein
MGKHKTSAEDMRTPPTADELLHVADVSQNKVYEELEGIFQGSDRLHMKKDQSLIAYM